MHPSPVSTSKMSYCSNETPMVEEVNGQRESITYTSKRKRRTAAEVAEDKCKREAKRIDREKERKDKEDETIRKMAERSVRQKLAMKLKGAKTPRFTWTTGATEELLELVALLKNEHDAVGEVTPGFISWTKFFKENAGRKELFDTLKDLPFDALERRYKVVCTTYKTVRDICAETGGGGMLDLLQKYNMSPSVYDAIGMLHSDNDAMNAVGGADIADVEDLTNASKTPHTYDSPDPFQLSDSDNDVGEITPSSRSRSHDFPKPPNGDKKVARKRGKCKEAGVDEGVAALMRMQVESQERMEKWSLKMEAEREKLREEREARREQQEARREKEREEERKGRETEREEERKDRAQEIKNSQMMNVMLMTMLGKISGIDMSQFNSKT